jgi:glutaredoxin
MTKHAQASPVFSVLLSVLRVMSVRPLRREKLLTQRTQRGAEKSARESSESGGQGSSAGDRNELQMFPPMDSLELKILAAFNAPGARARSLSELGDPTIVNHVASQLVERGWLRVTEAPDTYARTEDGRLQLAGPRDVTIYSRPGCHLCEEAKKQIAPLLKEFGARLTEINIDEDPELRARYDYDVPVIFLAAQKAAKHRVDLAQFRRQLRDAPLK